MTEDALSRIVDSARIDATDTVVVVGRYAEPLMLGALGSIGEDGSVIVVDESADRLEAIRTACRDPRVSYLIGDAAVLPLPDASADVVLVTGEFDKGELERVIREDGRIGSAP